MIEEQINVYDEPSEDEINVMEESLEDGINVNEEAVIINSSVKELFIVTVNFETGLTSHSPAEILEAVNNNLYPVMIIQDRYSIVTLTFPTIEETDAYATGFIGNSAVSVHIDENKGFSVSNIEYATMDDIPDVSDFITRSVDDLINYYTKTETYTQAEVNNLIGAISTITIEVVQQKPQNPQTNVIYFIPKNPAEQDNIYDEWIYVNNNWELIGTTEIDLSNYYTKTETNNLLNAKQDKIDSSNKLSADLVDDTNSANKFVSDTDITYWDDKVDQSQLDDYYTKPINNSLGGIMMPDTTSMTPIKTIEYNLASNQYFKFMSIANTFTNFDDVAGECLFRITTTGASVNITECYFSLRQASNFMPYIIVRNRPGAGVLLAANTGLRYIRYAYPKALNSGYAWDLEFNAINNNARHIKIEVFSNSNNVTWYESLTPSTLNTTNQTSSIVTLSTSDSLNMVGTFNMTVSNATSAQYLNSYLPKFLSGTLPQAGEAILAQQFIFKSNKKCYPSSNKTTAIDTGFGIQLSSNNVNLNSAVPNTGLRQKYNNATLTHIPHATLTAGDECYFRCTMDGNGNILSDDYVDTSMSAGYTWYYIGNATSASAINVDTTQSVFMTIDSNGKLTHINGKPLATGQQIPYTEEGYKILLGTGTSGNGYSTAVGVNANSTGRYSVAYGQNTQATQTGTIAIGHEARANQDGSMAFGRGAMTEKSNQVVFGGSSPVTEIAIGSQFNYKPLATQEYVDNKIQEIINQLSGN